MRLLLPHVTERRLKIEDLTLSTGEVMKYSSGSSYFILFSETKQRKLGCKQELQILLCAVQNRSTSNFEVLNSEANKFASGKKAYKEGLFTFNKR